jgi:hypothetical protein
MSVTRQATFIQSRTSRDGALTADRALRFGSSALAPRYAIATRSFHTTDRPDAHAPSEHGKHALPPVPGQSYYFFAQHEKHSYFWRSGRRRYARHLLGTSLHAGHVKARCVCVINRCVHQHTRPVLHFCYPVRQSAGVARLGPRSWQRLCAVQQTKHRQCARTLARLVRSRVRKACSSK